MKPGEIILGDGPIVLNSGRPVVEIEVENTSDHTVWIGSHFPFFEVNRRFARAARAIRPNTSFSVLGKWLGVSKATIHNYLTEDGRDE